MASPGRNTIIWPDWNRCFAHADAYAGYNDAYRTGRVTEMTCMVHIRRDFVKIFENYQLPAAGEAIERIAKLYDVEKQARLVSKSRAR